MKKGQKHSEETRAKMVKSHQNRKENRKEPKYSEESKRKMVESKLAENNPNYDYTNYHFIHKDGRTFTGTKLQFRTKYGLDRSALCRVTKGERKSTGGWKLKK